jgi:hypothetical protein
MYRVNSRGEVVNAGGGRHGGGEVAFGVCDVVVVNVVVEGSGESGAWWGKEQSWGQAAGEKCFGEGASCRHFETAGLNIYGRYGITTRWEVAMPVRDYSLGNSWW